MLFEILARGSSLSVTFFERFVIPGCCNELSFLFRNLSLLSGKLCLE
jgi:hypothetical protein